MNSKIFVIISVFVLTVSVALTQKAKAGQEGKSQTETKATKEENKAVPLHESEENFNKAHESFLNKDIKTTASEIRKAIWTMKSDISHAATKGKALLQKSVNELEKLANDLEHGVVVSEEKVENVFSNARSAIAKHRQLQASSKTK